jgi:hypothetical protein
MLNRLVMIALAIIVSSAFGARPARAAGCHVPDRPILATRYTWDRVDRLDRARAVDAPAPTTLTRVPCSGESPQPPGASSVMTSQADRPVAVLKPPSVSELSTFGDDILSIDPHPFRLDRPPRHGTPSLA